MIVVPYSQRFFQHFNQDVLSLDKVISYPGCGKYEGAIYSTRISVMQRTHCFAVPIYNLISNRKVWYDFDFKPVNNNYFHIYNVIN